MDKLFQMNLLNTSLIFWIYPQHSLIDLKVALVMCDMFSLVCAHDLEVLPIQQDFSRAFNRNFEINDAHHVLLDTIPG